MEEKMKKTKRVLVVLGFLFLCSFAFAEIINVPADQPTIQQGINVAVNSDTVLVQPGTYIENINYNGKSIVLGSLFLTIGNPAYIAETVIDGNNIASVVIIENATGTTAVLCGFTITNGYCYFGGGGVSCMNNSSITLKNLIVSNNLTDTVGGGIYLSEISNATIEDVVAIENACGMNGGGIMISQSEAFLTNVKALDNYSNFSGGGIHCQGGTIVIENSQMSGNASAWSGGGGEFTDTDFLNMNNIMVSDNYAEGSGGGLVFFGNDGIVKLSNSVIIGNSGSFGSWGSLGAGILVGTCTAEFTNVTFSDNFCEMAGACCWVSFGTIVTFVDCIMWNNSPDEIGINDSPTNPTVITISYCDIQGGQAGIEVPASVTFNWMEGNIDEDPLFAFTGEHLYSLLEDSPCINAGIPDTTGLNLPEYDFAGNSRVLNGRIDMGAYEITTSISTDFIASYTEGPAPFTVEFTDLTTGYPTEWEWDFDSDGVIDSYDQNPEWTFEEQGYYTVTLTSSNEYNEDTEIKENYIHVTEGVSSDEDIMPIASQLIGNYPNPFNPITTISFITTANTVNTKIVIYNIKGQKVKTLANNRFNVGTHQVVWDGKDENGKSVTSGIYFYKMNSGKFTSTKKMILMK
ncbi:MAG: T9SS type A sorting domain-containing protein [Candidatus Cloacimonetes bacterium]|nr:T9SS type A sorting domain-containing protein [Candidatus Cloacimonadota bacterium]